MSIKSLTEEVELVRYFHVKIFIATIEFDTLLYRDNSSYTTREGYWCACTSIAL